MRIAIIGAGISGLAFAKVLSRFSHECVVFEKNDRIGGIWALSYPSVRLQNSREQYHFSDFPWPDDCDQHPTATQVLTYLDRAIERFNIDVRLNHKVIALEEIGEQWKLSVRNGAAQETLLFDYVVVSIGQYAEGKNRPSFDGEELFSGTIVTERDVKSLDVFDDKRVAVVGFGKSALDMVALAVERARRVDHLFRTPRWLVPFRLLGIHYTYPFFPRASTIFMPSWVHGSSVERSLHKSLPIVVKAFWKMITLVIRQHIRAFGKNRDAAGKARLDAITPPHSFVRDLRSATAMAPQRYFEYIGSGAVEPHQGELKGFDESGLCLSNGAHIDADVAVLSLGSNAPEFPFLPQHYRDLLEGEPDGVQLYRHVLHPRVPRLAFAGYNHGFLHVPAAEIGALWLGAVVRGDITLPSSEEMERSLSSVRDWKREHIQFEPSRSCAVSTRFQQYIDAMLLELKISRWRKMPNIFAECFSRYGASDYANVVDEYLAREAQAPHAVLQKDV